MELDAPRRYLLQLLAGRDADLSTVSKAIGRNHAYLQQYIQRGSPRKLPEDVRDALGEYFGVEPDTLKSGMPKSADDEFSSAPSDAEYSNVHEIVTEYAPLKIDELDIRVGAGAGQLAEGVGKMGHWALPRELVRLATPARAERIKIVTVVGDSMTPTFNPTDRIMIDTSDTNPSPPGVFVVWDGFGQVVKRVEFMPHSEPPTVRISSDNQRYAPYERSLGEAYIQGRVIGKWQWS